MAAFLTPATISIRSSQLSTISSQQRPRLYLIPHRKPVNLPIHCAASPETPETPAAPPFELRGFSLANVGLALGFGVTILSFTAYFKSNGTASASSLGFVYGIPILLIGCALKYAELPPIAVESSPEASAARASGTEIQKKIYSDITRHRYGDEAHLQPALASLGLIPRGEACPVLQNAAESVEGGQYCIQLVFESLLTPYKEWESKQEKFERFFGPNVTVVVEKRDKAKRLVALSIINTSK